MRAVPVVVAFNVVGVALDDPTAASAVQARPSFLTGHPQLNRFDSGDAPSASGDNGRAVYLGTGTEGGYDCTHCKRDKVVQIGFLLDHATAG